LVGLGETIEELVDAMKDLRSVACDGITIGQYIPPSNEHYPVAKYYHPDEFAELESIAENLGFSGIASSPLVRSSYHAGNFFKENIKE
jgi:lipoic acid synthetase